MTLTTISENVLMTGIPFSTSIADANFVVLEDVAVASVDEQHAFNLLSDDHDLEVRGLVTGGLAIRLGANALTSGHSLVVGVTGSVYGSQDGAQIFGATELVNDGQIVGGLRGMILNLDGGTSRLVNHGNIAGGSDDAIRVTATGGTTVRLVNDGIIDGRATYSYNSQNNNFDLVKNRGTLWGEVNLGGGNDVFDNVGGKMKGGVGFGIHGGEGDDRFLPGAGAERIVAGDGIDTLDFRSSTTGLRVNLADADGVGNTGRAKNDRYVDIERIWGSSTGSDTLIGNGQDNTFSGFGGADILRGGEGDDTLIGGAGQDRLTGGFGYDVFHFAKPSHGGDRITDFSVDDDIGFDLISIDASGFGGGLPDDGAVTGAMFSAQLTNVAETAAVRFLWETDSTRLWFDRNGNAPGGLFLIADLQAGAEFNRFFIDLV